MRQLYGAMRSLAEETILMISVFKWFVLASIIGVLVGGATAAFILFLQEGTAFAGHYPHYYYLLPFALFLSSLLTLKLAPEAEGHGTEKVIEAVHKRSGHIKAKVVPVKLLATLLTLVAGGSAGKEGPCAQIGGGIASTVAGIFCFNDTDRKKLVICGISAGFAAVFGTPIAGAIFGIEVLYIGTLMYDVLLPSFIAGITSYQISSALGVTYFYHPIDLVPTFSQLYFIEVVVGGIFLGFCCLLLIETIHFFKRIADRIHVWMPFKAFGAGVLMVAFARIFSDRYLGLGLDTIEATLNGTPANWWDSVAKIVFTSITITFGGSGGLVTPIFFIGSTFGSLYASVMHLDPSTFAAIGMVSLLAGAANTPIAASILAMEIFGPQIAPYASVACVTCFLITGHRSVYPSQITAAMKSASIRGNLGEEIEEVQMEFILRQHTPTSYIVSLVKKFLTRSACRIKKDD